MSVDLLSLFPAGLMKVVGNGEYAGPCPWCGTGRDRFRLWPEREMTETLYWCRKCGVSGDGIALTQKLTGVGYRDALAALGLAWQEGGSLQPKGQPAGRGFPLPAGRKNSGAGGCPVGRGSGSGSGLALDGRHALFLPGETWRRRAAAFLQGCQQSLDLSEGAARWLCAWRYIHLESCGPAPVGWNDSDRYFLRSEWGLEGSGKLRVPRGIVLGSVRGGEVVSLCVRLPEDKAEKDPRYWETIGGQRAAPFIAGQKGLPTFITEGAIDALLLWQFSGRRICAVGMNGCTKLPDDEVMAIVGQAPLLVCVPDQDDAGRAAWQRWQEWWPMAVCCPVPAGKDPGELQELALSWPIQDNIPTLAEFVPAAVGYARSQQKREAA